MLDLLSSAPQTVKFGQRTLLIGALKLKELGLLQRYIRDHAPKATALAQAELQFFPAEEHQGILKTAAIADRDWPPAVGSWDGNSVLFSNEEGQRYFLGVMLRKFQPDLDDAFVDSVTAGLSDEDFGVLIKIAFGEDSLDPLEVRRQARARLTAGRASEAAPTLESSTTPTLLTLPT